MSERRYNEEEIATIFERASDAEARGRAGLPSAEGMTLAELEEIGKQVGLSPALVAQAARSLEVAPTSMPPAVRTRTMLGLPIGVGRTVHLGRKLSDAEWERLVVELRQTFEARGRVREDGSFKQWTNGNLHALLEPSENGHQLRLGTTNANARMYIGIGLSLLGFSAVLFGVNELAAGGLDAKAVRVVSMLSALGLGMFGIGALRLPSWARRRREQMAAIASRVLSWGTQAGTAARTLPAADE